MPSILYTRSTYVKTACPGLGTVPPGSACRFRGRRGPVRQPRLLQGRAVLHVRPVRDRREGLDRLGRHVHRRRSGQRLRHAGDDTSSPARSRSIPGERLGRSAEALSDGLPRTKQFRIDHLSTGRLLYVLLDGRRPPTPWSSGTSSPGGPTRSPSRRLPLQGPRAHPSASRSRVTEKDGTTRSFTAGDPASSAAA